METSLVNPQTTLGHLGAPRFGPSPHALRMLRVPKSLPIEPRAQVICAPRTGHPTTHLVRPPKCAFPTGFNPYTLRGAILIAHPIPSGVPPPNEGLTPKGLYILPQLEHLMSSLSPLVRLPSSPTRSSLKCLRLERIPVRVGSQDEGLNAHTFSCHYASPLRPPFLQPRAGRLS